ncbi:antibiotic biosynthesis monooxygenase family protein [Sporosarcina sp. CAU 1771]
MNIFLTSGTFDFMKSLREKYPSETMVVMSGAGNAVLLHETNGKSLFQTPRRYKTIGESGTLTEEGYFVFNNIPVTDEGRPIFEHQISKWLDSVDLQQRNVAFRLLSPIDSNTYIVLSQWSDAAGYHTWKNSTAAQQLDRLISNESGASKMPHMFSSASYVTTYMTKKKK